MNDDDERFPGFGAVIIGLVCAVVLAVAVGLACLVG